MSLHLAAKPGDIADTVLIAGDPLRARYIASNMLEKSVCYNEIRGMFGFTGFYKGRRISVQGTGMGIPSTAIYAHELINEYGVKRLIRVGTCGAIQKDLSLGDLILAESAFTDSNAGNLLTKGKIIPVAADYNLLAKTMLTAAKLAVPVHVGSVFSTDLFYHPDRNRWKTWTERGVLGVEMETSILYTMATLKKVSAMTLLVVSDNILSGAALSAADREKMGSAGIELVLETLVSIE